MGCISNASLECQCQPDFQGPVSWWYGRDLSVSFTTVFIVHTTVSGHIVGWVNEWMNEKFWLYCLMNDKPKVEYKNFYPNNCILLYIRMVKYCSFTKYTNVMLLMSPECYTTGSGCWCIASYSLSKYYIMNDIRDGMCHGGVERTNGKNPSQLQFLWYHSLLRECATELIIFKGTKYRILREIDDRNGSQERIRKIACQFVLLYLVRSSVQNLLRGILKK